MTGRASALTYSTSDRTAHAEPSIRLDASQLVNISQGGLAFTTDHLVEVGSQIIAMVGPEASDGKITLEVLQCAQAFDSERYNVRCRLLNGAISARLVFCF